MVGSAPDLFEEVTKAERSRLTHLENLRKEALKLAIEFVAIAPLNMNDVLEIASKFEKFLAKDMIFKLNVAKPIQIGQLIPMDLKDQGGR